MQMLRYIQTLSFPKKECIPVRHHSWVRILLGVRLENRLRKYNFEPKTRLILIPKTVRYKSEPTVPQLEHLFISLLTLYKKLKDLGFTYYNGTVSVIDIKEDTNE